MENPFLRRASEQLRDAEAFLSVVSPEPLQHYLLPAARSGVLFDKLVVVRGTPGSGKTTLARLFEYSTLAALLKNKVLAERRGVIAALTDCGALLDGIPKVLACRVPLETDYREIWGLPYEASVRHALTMSLIQARAVLLWLKNLREAGIDASQVEFSARKDAEGALESIGGSTGEGLERVARSIERDLYRSTGALVPPKLDALPPSCTRPYRPFDVLQSVQFRAPTGEWASVRPLAVLDDAHILHPEQYRSIRRDLSRREIRVARWMLARLDVMDEADVLRSAVETEEARPALPGVNTDREITTITFQTVGSEKRNEARRRFRSMAKDMSTRYLGQMRLFADRNLRRLDSLLDVEVPPMADGKLRELKGALDSALGSGLGNPLRVRQDVETRTEEYLSRTKSLDEGIRLAMMRILVERLLARSSQLSLFDDAEHDHPDSRLRVDSGVREGARVALHHHHGRPLYYGIDDLCDAASENAEQFLHLAAELVEVAATNIVRSRSASVDPATQTKMLRARAKQIKDDWDFPYCVAVRNMVDGIANRCLARSLEPNAPLDGGASAFGVLQEEYEALASEHPELAKILKFAIAYNALTVVADHSCKLKRWCLFYLGGVPLLSHGLTLKRGGFVEGSTRELSLLAQGRQP